MSGGLAPFLCLAAIASGSHAAPMRGDLFTTAPDIKGVLIKPLCMWRERGTHM